MAPQDQPVSNVANQPTSSTIARRNWILYLPPEVRLINYDYVLRIPHRLPYDLYMIWVHPALRFRTSILRTSRFLRREGIDFFFRENTFSIGMILPLFQTVPRRISDMIQNIDIHIHISNNLQGARDQFTGIIQNFGDPAIIRRTFNVHVLLPLRYRRRQRPPPLDFFLRGLAQFTHFQIIDIDILYRRRHGLSTAIHCQRVENALRFVLGPASPHAGGNGLTFFPQQFLRGNAQPTRENVDWMDYLDGVRLDWNEEEVTADGTADESEQPTQNSNSQG